MQDQACVEHDERLLDLLAELAAAQRAVLQHDAYLLRYLGLRRDERHPRGAAGALADLQALIDAGDAWRPSYSDRPSKVLENNRQVHANLEAAFKAFNDHEAGFDGWDRYFLVTSSDGHIHRSMHCSTCNNGRSATGFALLPRLSDTSTDTAVAALGAALCSVCYPDAPVDQREQTKLPSRVVEILLKDGEPAFRAALAEYNEKAAQRAKARCPGSGTGNIVSGTVRQRYPSDIAKCGVCDTFQSLTSARNLRPHKR